MQVNIPYVGSYGKFKVITWCTIFLGHPDLLKPLSIAPFWFEGLYGNDASMGRFVLLQHAHPFVALFLLEDSQQRTCGECVGQWEQPKPSQTMDADAQLVHICIQGCLNGGNASMVKPMTEFCSSHTNALGFGWQRSHCQHPRYPANLHDLILIASGSKKVQICIGSQIVFIPYNRAFDINPCLPASTA